MFAPCPLGRDCLMAALHQGTAMHNRFDAARTLG
jgi:hypothetical protein